MIARNELNRFEKIIFDTLVTWQDNWQLDWKQKSNETFDLDELLSVIQEYGPWTNPERELPWSATLSILSWFAREGLIKSLGNNQWEILISTKADPPFLRLT